MLATPAANHVRAAHSDPCLAEVRNVTNLAELTAHWQNLQHFLQHWGTRQEQLLMCGDASSLVDAAQIHLMEVGHSHDCDNSGTTCSSKEQGARGVFGFQEQGSEEGGENLQKQCPRPPDDAVFQCSESTIEKGGKQGAIRIQLSDECQSQTSSSIRETQAKPVRQYSPSTESDSPVSPIDSHQAHIQQLQNFRINRSSQFDSERSTNRKVFCFDSRKVFDVICGVFIFANTIMTGAISDYAIKNPLQETPVFLARCEISFIVFYTFEIVLRMLDQRRKYFTGGDKLWNMFDVALVIQGLSEQMQSLVMASSDEGLGNFSFLRMLRLMKMLKLLRMVRLLRMFRELRLILGSIFACVTSMLWTGVLILAITYLFGIAFIQACTAYLQLPDDNIDPRVRASIEEFWSSAPRSILSLYMASLGGTDWDLMAEPLWHVGFGGAYYFLFLIYIAVFTFVVMNVISSIFLESILSMADNDHQLNMEKQMALKAYHIHNLQKLFDLIDDDKSGEISYDEFMAHAHSPQMQAFTASLQIDISDASSFFLDISDRGKRLVDMDTFVVGCIKLKGPAKSVDVVDLKYCHKKSYAAQRKNSIELHEMATMLNTTVHELHKVASEQNKSIVERQASDQRVLRDLATLTTYVKASAAATGAPATTQSKSACDGFHLQL